MSEEYTNDTAEWCDSHAIARAECGCPWRDEDADRSGRRRLKLTQASTVKMRRPKWLIGQMIPLRAVTLLAGREGLGKSTLWAMWASTVTTGTTESVDVECPAGVLIVANEDAIDSTIVPRLVAAGADLERVHFVTAETGIGLTDSVTIPLDTEQLIERAKDVDARLIIIDPLVSILDGKLDSHKDHSIRQALDPIGRVAERADTAVLGLVHLNKGQGSDVLDRVLGSRAFTAAARSVVALIRDDEDDTDTRRLVVHAKSNLGPRQQQALVIEVSSVEVDTSEGLATVSGVQVVGVRDVELDDLMTRRGPDDVDDLSEAGRWLLDYLYKSGGQAERKDVLEDGKKAGHSPDQLKRARVKAGVTVERRTTFPTSSVWHFPQSAQLAQLTQAAQSREHPAPTVEMQSEHPHLVSTPTTPTAPTAPTVVTSDRSDTPLQEHLLTEGDNR